MGRYPVKFDDAELVDLIMADQGYDPGDTDSHHEFIADQVTDSVNLGACRSCGTVHVSCEPDASTNHCDNCGHYNVAGVLVLLGWM